MTISDQAIKSLQTTSMIKEVFEEQDLKKRWPLSLKKKASRNGKNSTRSSRRSKGHFDFKEGKGMRWTLPADPPIFVVTHPQLGA